MTFADLNAACADAFGEPVVLRRDGQPDATVDGIFDRRHYEDGLGEGGRLSTLITSVTVASDAVGGGVARVVVRGVERSVVDAKPDGQGMTVLILRS